MPPEAVDLMSLLGKLDIIEIELAQIALVLWKRLVS